MQNESPESKVLERYQRQISALPLDDQLERAQKNKSPQTLRRLLSADAPDEIVGRFCHRLKEVADLGLSTFEVGRVLLRQGNMTEAKKSFDAAIKTGDLRAHPELATIALLENKNQEAEQHLKIAIKNNIATYTAHLQLCLIYLRNQQHDKANEHGKLAMEQSKEPENLSIYLEIMKNLYAGKLETKAEIAALEALAKKGYAPAIDLLIKLYQEENNDRAQQKTIEYQIKLGETKLYLTLGEMQLKAGQTKEAEITYRRAFKAGHPEAAAALAALILDRNGDIAEAKAFCEEAIKSGEATGYLGMANILSFEGKQQEAADYLLQCVQEGIKIPTTMIAGALGQLGRYEEAIALCKPKVAKEPKLHFMLGILYKEIGNKKEEDEQFEMGIIRNGLQAEMKRVKKLRRQGKNQEATLLFAQMIARAMNDLGLSDDAISEIAKKEVKKRMN